MTPAVSDPAGIKTLLDDMAPRNPKAAAADPKIFVDQSFVQEMESSGFIKRCIRDEGGLRANDQAMRTFDRRFIDEMEKDGFCDKLAR